MRKILKFKTQLIAFVYAMLVAVLLVGCDTPQGERHEKDGYSTVVIEGCEYIEVSNWIGSQSGYYSLTHKGNCKYCLARNVK